MNILILSQYYDPEPIPKPGDLARELRRRGHRVTVLTGYPNYPSGKLYDGFRLAVRRREHDGDIPVIRAFEYPYHGRRALGRILNYVSFMLAAPLGSIGAGPFDVIYVWHPPLTVGVAAWLTGAIHRAPFVYDVQDVWPDAAILSGILRPGLVADVLRVVERFVYRRAAHILVPTEETRQNLLAKGVVPAKVTSLPHWVDAEQFDDTARAERDALRAQLGWTDKFVLLFTGNLGLVQGLDTVIEAAARVSRPDVCFAFVGDGADRDRLQELSATFGLHDRVRFIDRQPARRMPAFMAAADALLVHLRPSELSRTVIPTKTLSYLAAGRPILMAMEGAAAALVEGAGAGIIAPPGDAASLADAVARMVDLPEAERERLGRNGREHLLAHFTMSAVMPRYLEVLAQVGARAAGGPPMNEHGA
jgi:glycosyltransferase involved in cell wall biosynthesis